MIQKKPKNQKQNGIAVISLQIDIKGAEKFERIQLLPYSLRLKQKKSVDKEIILPEKYLELQSKHEFSSKIKFEVPSGCYDGLTLMLRQINGLPHKETSWTELSRSVFATVDKQIDLKSNLENSLSIKSSLDEFLKNKISKQDIDSSVERWNILDGQRSETIRFDYNLSSNIPPFFAEISLQPNTFSPQTELILRRSNSDTLPTLFRGQQVVGPILEISTSSAPHGLLDITLAYSPEELAKTGINPTDIVVLELTKDRNHYHEIRPYKVDVNNQTVSIRTNSLSFFFACTPGILIDSPELVINSADDIIAYSETDKIHVAGRVVDDRAHVSLIDANYSESWTSKGWFVFEEVRLEGRSDVNIMLHVEVEGIIAHTCDFTVRLALPTKTITQKNTNSLFAGTPVFADDGTPFVTAVLQQSVKLKLENIDDWVKDTLSKEKQNIPKLFWFDSNKDKWNSFRLLSDHYFDNEFAKVIIYMIELFDSSEVPINESYPLDVRYIRSLSDFIKNPVNNVSLDSVKKIFTLFPSGPYDADSLSISSNIPTASLTKGNVCCCFVAASFNGVKDIERTNIENFLRPRYVARKIDRGKRFGINLIRAGRLFFIRASNQGIIQTEEIADDIICASLSLRINPKTKEPCILASGLMPEGDTFSKEIVVLHLFQRQIDGTWTDEIVWKHKAVISADFDFDSNGAPHVVATVDNGSELNGDLHYLIRTENTWSDMPLIDDKSILPKTITGMWPRVIIDNFQHVNCAYVVFTPYLITWFLAQRNSKGWSGIKIGQGTIEDLGITNAEFTFWKDDMISASNLGFNNWAPSLARGFTDTLWYSYGNGVTHLAKINSQTLDVNDRVFDIDQTTGFVPQLTTRHSGAPALAYKDLYGKNIRQKRQGIELTTYLDLHFFDLSTSHQVPHSSTNKVTPRQDFFRDDIGDFGKRFPFTCESLLGAAIGGVNNYLASLLMNGTTDVNLKFEGKKSASIELILHNDLPIETNAIHSIHITKVDDNTPTLKLVDSRGKDACGFSQEVITEIEPISQFLNKIPIENPSNFNPNNLEEDEEESKLKLEFILISGIKISSRFYRPPNIQQGGFIFKIELPHIHAKGSYHGIEANVDSIEPTVFEYVFSPFVDEGKVEWHTRFISAKYGHFATDVILLPPIAEDVVGSIVGGKARQKFSEKGGQIGGSIVKILKESFKEYVDNKISKNSKLRDGVTIEAVHQEIYYLNYFLRKSRKIRELQQPGFIILRELLAFDPITTGDESKIKGVVLTNGGHLPVSVEQIQIVGTNEFVLVNSSILPKILTSGAHMELFLQFKPTGNAGSRNASLKISYNGSKNAEMDLFGDVLPKPEPKIEVLPKQLNFGVVDVGSTSTLGVNLFNNGASPLEILEFRIEGDPQDATSFILSRQPPPIIPPTENAVIEISFRPSLRLSEGHKANLVIGSNDPDNPQIILNLFGMGDVSNIFVVPTEITFGESSLDSTLPPGDARKRWFTIYNLGGSLLTILQRSFFVYDVGTGQPSSHFKILDSSNHVFTPNDVQVNGGESISFKLQFRPIVEGVHDAIINIESSDRAQPRIQIRVSGRGIN